MKLRLVHSAAAAGARTFIRAPSLDPTYLRRALQIGAEGVILDQLRPGGPSVHAPPSFLWALVGVTTEAVSDEPK